MIYKRNRKNTIVTLVISVLMFFYACIYTCKICKGESPSRTIAIVNDSNKGVNAKDSDGHIVAVNSNRTASLEITDNESRDPLRTHDITVTVTDDKGFIGSMRIGEQTKKITINKNFTLSLD